MPDVRTRIELENVSRATTALLRTVGIRGEQAPGAAPGAADLLATVGPAASTTGAAAYVQVEERPRLRLAWATTIERK